MTAGERLILPADVALAPARTFPDAAIARLAAADDVVVSRPGLRASFVIDAGAARLLALFRTPHTVAEAALAFNQYGTEDLRTVLADALPFVEHLMVAGVLVPAGSPRADPIVASFVPGERVAGCRVVRCVQALADAEVYEVRDARGRRAALKIVRPAAGGESRRALAHEAEVLATLDGAVNPPLLDTGSLDGRPYLVTGWCAGVHASAVAARLRHGDGARDRSRLGRLCCAILDAYARLHAQGVVHGDVHPRNVIVAGSGSVKIVDYALAVHTHDSGSASSAAPLCSGVAELVEPEHAARLRRGEPPTPPTALGEQYSLAAMCYLLHTGSYYTPLSPDLAEMLRQIAEDEPLAFAESGAAPWPAVERLLGRALCKEPAGRFASVAELAGEMRRAVSARVGHAHTARQPERAPARAGGGRRAARALLERTLRRLHADGADGAGSYEWTGTPSCSLWCGMAGAAYAAYRIALVRDDPALLACADVWATKAAHRMGEAAAFYDAALELTPDSVGRVSPYHAAGGVHCVRAFVAHAFGDREAYDSAVVAFVAASEAPCQSLDLTLGRSGSLLACAHLYARSATSAATGLRGLGDQLAQSLTARASDVAAMRTSEPFPYLGVAHGWAGLLYSVLLWSQVTGGSPPAPVRAALAALAERGRLRGRGARWPWSATASDAASEEANVPGWCHGSAGFVHLWTLAFTLLDEEAYLELAERAAWSAWEHPAGGDDLCCGLAGRAYGLLSFYNCTGERPWLRRAQVLAERAVGGIERSARVRDGLYNGPLGVALLAADLERPELAAMPFFESEGWPA